MNGTELRKKNKKKYPLPLFTQYCTSGPLTTPSFFTSPQSKLITIFFPVCNEYFRYLSLGHQSTGQKQETIDTPICLNVVFGFCFCMLSLTPSRLHCWVETMWRRSVWRCLRLFGVLENNILCIFQHTFSLASMENVKKKWIKIHVMWWWMLLT